MNLLSWAGKEIKGVAQTVNRDVIQPVAHAAAPVVQAVGNVEKAAVNTVAQAPAALNPLNDVRLAGRVLGATTPHIPTFSSSSPLRFANNAIINPVKTTGFHVSQLAQGHDPYHGSVKQQVGQVGQDVLNLATAAPIGRGASIAVKEAPLLSRLATGAKLGAKAGSGFGAAQGLTSSFQNNANLPQTLKNVATNAAIGGVAGAGLGTAAPVVGEGLKLGVKSVPKVAQNASEVINNRVPLNQVGAVGKNAGNVSKHFGTSDPYVYHADATNAPISKFAKDGIKPSVKGQSGPGVYLANTIKNTEYHYSSKLGEKPTIYRVDKQALVNKFGKYPANKNGIQFDHSTGEILLDGNRNVPPEFVQAKQGNTWKPISQTNATNKITPQQFAIDHFNKNKPQATSDYQNMTMQDFGTKTPNIVSADTAKYVVPGFSPSKSGVYHEGSSVFAKNYYKQLLADQTTKNKPVLITGGGMGAGKTSGLALLNREGHALDGYSAINDTNLTNLKSATSRIEPALKSGRKVEVQYTYRDPVDAFVNGNIPRAAKVGRVGAIATHVDTHLGSLKTIQQIAQKYKDNPNVTTRIIDNSRGRGNQTIAPIYFLKDKVYNRAELTRRLQDELQQAYNQGHVSPEAYKAYQEGLRVRSPRNQNSAGYSAQPEAQRTRQLNGALAPPLKPTGRRAGVSRLNKAMGTELQSSSYTKRPQATLDAASNAAANKDLNSFTGKVQKALSQTPGRLTDQQLSDAYVAAQRHAEAGNTQLSDELLTKTLAHDTRTAQALAARGLMTKATPLGMQKMILNTLKKANVPYEGKLKERVTSAMNEVKATKPGTQEREFAVRKLANEVTQHIPRSKAAAAAQFWRAMLISGPTTAAKVAISQPFTGTQAFLNQFPAAALDATRSLVTGKPRTTAASFKGLGSGFKEGLHSAGVKLRTGVDVPGSGGFVSPFEQQLQRGTHQTLPERAIFALHSSIQKPVFGAIRNNTLARLGKAEAINQGLRGSDRLAFIDNYIKNPPKDAYAHAISAGEKATNQQKTELGAAANKIQQSGHGAGMIIAPITRVPGAIGTNALYEYSGVKFAKTAIIDGLVKRGKTPDFSRTIAEDFGKAVVGAGGVSALGAILGATGNLTPAKFTSQKEAALAKRRGQPAGAVHLPGTNVWLSLNAMGPVGIELASGGGLGRGYKGDSIAKNQSGIPGAISEGLASGAQELAQQPYVQGITGVGNVLQDPVRYARSFGTNLATSTIPALVSQTAAGTDPNQRTVNYNSVTDVAKSKVPVLREKIPASTDVLGGRNVGANPNGTIPGGILGILDAFKSSGVKNANDPPTNELVRLNNSLPSTDSPAIAAPVRTQNINGKNVQLTDQQLADYTSMSGQLIHQGVTNLLHNSDYQQLSDANKSQQVDKVITAAHNAAKQRLFGAQTATEKTNTDKALNDPRSLGTTVSKTPSKSNSTSKKGSKSSTPKVPSETTTVYDPKSKSWTQTNHTTGKVTQIDSTGKRTVLQKGTSTAKGKSSSKTSKTSKASGKSSLTKYLSVLKSTNAAIKPPKTPSAPKFSVKSTSLPSSYKQSSLKRYAVNKPTTKVKKA